MTAQKDLGFLYAFARPESSEKRPTAVPGRGQLSTMGEGAGVVALFSLRTAAVSLASIRKVFLAREHMPDRRVPVSGA